MRTEIYTHEKLAEIISRINLLEAFVTSENEHLDMTDFTRDGLYFTFGSITDDLRATLDKMQDKNQAHRETIKAAQLGESMHLSRMIATLQAMQALHGDCKVSTNDYDSLPVVKFNIPDGELSAWVDIR